MRYVPIASVQLVHAYHSDGRCPDVELRLPTTSARALAGQRMIVKERPDGVLLLAQVDGQGEPFVALDEATTIRFELHLREHLFSRYTDLSALRGLDAPLLTNDDAPEGGALTLRSRQASASEEFTCGGVSAGESFVLRGRPRAGAQADELIVDGDPAPSLVGYDEATRVITVDCSGLEVGARFILRYPVRTAPPRGAFAELELRGSGSAWLGQGPARFTFAFTPRRVRWLYYLVTDVAEGTFSIVDSAPEDQALLFSEGRDLRADPDVDDPQASALIAHYPDKRCFRFRSDALIPCSETARRTLELHLDGERLPFTLPNPPLVNDSSREVVVEQVPQRQESLFRVVKHLTSSITANG